MATTSAGLDAPRHTWRFFRAGGFDQVTLSSAGDLNQLAALDKKLWAALSCPTTGLEIEARTLALIDTDGDGRIRAPELLAAVAWACKHLRRPEELYESGAPLKLAAIAEGPEGERLASAARQILANLGKANDESISVEDVSDAPRIFASTPFNGDGVVTEDSTTDPTLQQAIRDIVGCLGGEPDRGGKLGVNAAKLQRFFEEAAAFDAWARGGEAAAVVAGGVTDRAYTALTAVRAKVDDYFARCRLAAFDGRTAVLANRSESEYSSAVSADLSADATPLAGFPMARVEAGRRLPLEVGVNPAWTKGAAALREHTVRPLLGDRNELGEDDWRGLVAKLAPYDAWRSSKPTTSVAALGEARVRELLSGGAREAIAELIVKDAALEPVASAVADVERLVRYRRDLGRLLRNFVTFREFYGAGQTSAFQCGSLYLDQRRCRLCVRVDDIGKHSTFAASSQICVVYCELQRRASGEKMNIVAAITNGDSDRLFVGRNGIFYDNQGRDWDATVVKIIEQPISIRQAFWSPYKKIAKLIEAQIQKFAQTRDKQVQDNAAASIERGAASGVAQPLADGSKKNEAPFDVAKFAGIFAAIGLAIGAIGGVLGALLAGFASLAWWQMPLAVVGLMLAASGPSMVLAWLKLRQRSVGPLLDANGWAVNVRAQINIPFGAALTELARLPPGARRDLVDPYAPKRRALTVVLTVVLVAVAGVALWQLGWLPAMWLP